MADAEEEFDDATNDAVFNADLEIVFDFFLSPLKPATCDMRPELDARKLALVRAA